MKIGPFHITRVKKTPAGLKIYPWQALTEDRVSPELRQIVAKVARSEVKSYLQEQQERLAEAGEVADPRGECVSSHYVENGHLYIYPQETP